MTLLNRREMIQTVGLGAACVLAPTLTASVLGAADPKTGLHELPPLPYAYDALEPHIDKLTMEIHHDKHHKAYVDNLNKALDGHPDLQKRSVIELIRLGDQLPKEIATAVINNGGGHINHSMFWEIMGPKGGEPPGALGKAITAKFGGYDKFKEDFTKAAMTRFGSGWAWLTVAKGGKLDVSSTPNQNTPYADGLTPILGIDVWEHAYYLKYQNKRADYIKEWFAVVNWPAVADRFDKASV
jgi:Fe-Mn family superoxide dismutase